MLVRSLVISHCFVKKFKGRTVKVLIFCYCRYHVEIFQRQNGNKNLTSHFQDAAVKQIDVPSFSGSFGILPNHVPSLAVLRPGVVTVFEAEGNVKKVIFRIHCFKSRFIFVNLKSANKQKADISWYFRIFNQVEQSNYLDSNQVDFLIEVKIN